MAWIYAMWVQCDSADEAQAIRAHFASWPGDVVDARCVWLRPDGLSLSGVGSTADAEAMTRAGHALLAHLREGPTFDVALVGVEVDDVRDAADVRRLLMADLTGVVCSDERWREAGSPDGFQPFRPGQRWRPYAGERHEP